MCRYALPQKDRYTQAKLDQVQLNGARKLSVHDLDEPLMAGGTDGSSASVRLE